MRVNIQHLEKYKVFHALYNHAARKFPDELLTLEEACQFFNWWKKFIFNATKKNYSSDARIYFWNNDFNAISEHPFFFTSINVKELMNPNITNSKIEFLLHVDLNKDVIDGEKYNEANQKDSGISAEYLINELRKDRIREIDNILDNSSSTDSPYYTSKTRAVYQSLNLFLPDQFQLNNIRELLYAQIDQFSMYELLRNNTLRLQNDLTTEKEKTQQNKNKKTDKKPPKPFLFTKKNESDNFTATSAWGGKLNFTKL